MKEILRVIAVPKETARASKNLFLLLLVQIGLHGKGQVTGASEINVQ